MRPVAYVLGIPVIHGRASQFLGCDVLRGARWGGVSRFLVTRTSVPPVLGNGNLSISMQLTDSERRINVRTKEVFMPALSSTMTEGVIVSWLKQPGDRVEVGEMIMTVESDKADMDVESFESGYLATILVDEGSSAGVGATVALIAENKEDIEKVKECGLDCIVSGSGSRHDGTTAVMNPEVSKEAPSAVTETQRSSLANSAPDARKPELIEVWMPALSSTMETGKIDAYYVELGANIKAGDIIMAVESDKASMDVEAFDSGILAYIVVDVGEEAKVGDAIAYLAKSEADVPVIQAWAKWQRSGSAGSTADAPPAQQTSSNASPSADMSSAPVVSSIPQSSLAPVVNTGRIVASPYAKKRAGELSVDLSRVQGTGPNGRIVEADVLSAARAGGAVAIGVAASDTVGGPSIKRTDGKIIATPDAKKVAKAEKIDLETVVGTGNFGRITAEDVLKAAGKAPTPKVPVSASTSPAPEAPQKKSPASTPRTVPEGAVAMTAMQKAVVQNMTASLSVPVFRVSYAIKTAAFDELYAKLKPKGVTVSALLAKAVAITLTKHPIMNAAYAPDSIVYRPDINIAMAVSLPDGGLITPTLKNADQIDLYSLSRTWKDLVRRSGEKALKPDEYNSGTFIISNLGMFGVDTFDAILPPGAPSILAVAASRPVVGIQANGLVGVHKEMKVNITCDHRLIYGAQAAEFLRDLANLIENDVAQLVM